MIRTVRVDLNLDEDSNASLSTTLELYGEAYGAHVAYFTTMRHVNKNRAQEIYDAVRDDLPELPSAMVQLARNQAAESVKAYNTRRPQKRWSKRPVYRARSARYDSRTVSLRGSMLSFSTSEKRVKTLIQLPTWFVEKYPNRKFKAASIGIDRSGQPYANLIFRVGEAPAARFQGKTVGVDRGIVNPVMTSEGWSPSGSEVRAKRRQHLYNRKTLQQKGTRSARRRLRQQAGREKRFMLDWNHKLSKALAGQSGVARYVLEDLSFKTPGMKGHSKKQRAAAKRRSDWAHAQLLELLAYKCEAEGVALSFVHPAFTSQDCSRCDYRHRDNRNRGRFSCQRCGFRASADENAAVNIRDRYLSSLIVSGAGPSEGPIDAPEFAVASLGARQRA